jgi:hypothetical protein
MTDEEVVLRNFRGQRYVYRQPREEAAVAVHSTDPEYLLQPDYEATEDRKQSVKPKRTTA